MGQDTPRDTGIGSNEPVNKLQDAVGAVVGKISASTMGSHSTGAFIANAAIGDLYEIEAAQVAVERTASPDIREMAQTIAQDHRRMTGDLSQLVSSGRVDAELPAGLDQRRQGMVDNLRQAPADEFDKRFIQQQAAAHEESLTLHRGYLEHGDNPELKQVVSQHLPMLEQHMQHVRSLADGGR